MNTIDNITIYLKAKKITKKAFLESIGKSLGYFNSTSNFSIDTICIISEQYPDLNLDWLITGKGSMLKSTQSNLSSNTEASEEESYMQLSKALEIIAKQQETISLLVKEIGLNQSSEENIEDQKKKRKTS